MLEYLRPEVVDDAVNVGLHEGKLDAALGGEGRPAFPEGHRPPLVVLGARRAGHLFVETVLDVQCLFMEQKRWVPKEVSVLVQVCNVGAALDIEGHRWQMCNG